MNFTIVSSVMTLISMIVFIGILYWAFSSNNKARFEELATHKMKRMENSHGRLLANGLTAIAILTAIKISCLWNFYGLNPK